MFAHKTPGHVCEVCKKTRHNSAQCWTVHPELILQTVYGAHPINYSIRNISPLSLQRGVHVMENFGGVGLGVLRMIVVADIVVRVYTYVDRDSVNQKIARHALIQLQLQHPHLILHSAIEFFNRMFMPQDISLIGPAALTNLVAHYGPVDIL